MGCHVRKGSNHIPPWFFLPTVQQRVHCELDHTQSLQHFDGAIDQEGYEMKEHHHALAHRAF